MIWANAEFCMAGLTRHYRVDVARMCIARMVSLWRQIPAIAAATADKWAEYEVARGAELYRREPIYCPAVPIDRRRKPEKVH
jgi:hypothetical protein